MEVFEKLRGFLWHQGIDGLGVGPQWLRRFLPYRKRFDTAARIHDDLYDHKGNDHSRYLADRYLLESMVRQSENDIQILFSIVYYIAVRVNGWMFYRYNRD